MAIISGIILTLIVSKLLSMLISDKKASSFTLELPPYRKPQFAKTLVRSLIDRTLAVLGRAAAAAAPAGLVLWLLGNIYTDGRSLLRCIADFFTPAGKLLGLDGEIITGFILGFPANEIILPIILMLYDSAASPVSVGNQLHSILTDNNWTFVTALCMTVLMMFHSPCATACITVKKETGSFFQMLVAMIIPTAVGVLLCLGIACIFRVLGVILPLQT